MASSNRSVKPFLLFTFALAVPAGAGLYFMTMADAPTSLPGRGFNLLGLQEQRASRYTPAAATRPVPMDDPSSPLPIAGRLRFADAARPRSGTASRNAGAGAPASMRQQEKQFLSRYGNELTRYQAGLGNITARYYQTDPVVREVDHAFGAMPRYMALKNRYALDHDPFQFVRDAIALPEVRREIASRMADPRVWRAALGMILDTLREAPPPAPIYGAAKDFFVHDATVSDYMTEFTPQVFKNLPSAAAGLPPNADLRPLGKVLADVSPQSAAAFQAAAPPSAH